MKFFMVSYFHMSVLGYSCVMPIIKRPKWTNLLAKVGDVCLLDIHMGKRDGV